MKVISYGSALSPKGELLFNIVEHESKHITALAAEGKHLVATAKNKKAQTKIESWCKEFHKGELKSAELIQMAFVILMNEKDFVYTKNKKESYREFLRIWSYSPLSNGKGRPLFPAESFDLMKDWYDDLFKLRVEKLNNEYIDEVSSDMMDEMEKALINEIFNELNALYFSKLTPEYAERMQKTLQPNKPSFKVVPLRQFEAWLTNRLDTIQRKNSTKENEISDLSDSLGIEKLIYLKELGVLDFLKNKRPFNTSTNHLATFLSAVTGEKARTLQSYLNAHFSKNNDNKNDFYKDSKTKERVKGVIALKRFKLD